MAFGKVAAVMLINKNKEVLMCLRDNKSTIPYPNTWGLIGGHLENDETSVEALKREVKEEINIDVIDPKYIGEFEDGVGNLVYIFISKINKQADEIVLTEGQKLEFFNYDKMIKQNIPLPFLDFVKKNKDNIF